MTGDPSTTARRATSTPAELRTALLGLAVVLVGFVAVAVVAAVTLPWSGTGDSYQHLDYAYQVMAGRLPAPEGHLWEPAGYAGAVLDGRQFASAHPPAFYVLVAVVAGPLLDDDWRLAVAVVRGLDIALGVLGIVALWWTGWLVGGRRRVATAVALPAVGSATFCYLRFSADVYNDLLLTAVTLSCFAVLTLALLRRHGPATTAVLAVLSAVGTATKATFVITLLLVLAGLVAAAVLHGRGGIGRRLLSGVAHAAAVGLVTALATGWFYLRNAGGSGSWYRSTPKSPVGDRTPKTLLDSLSNPDYWLVVPRGLVGRGSPDFSSTAAAASLTVVGAAVAIGLAVLLVSLVRRRGRTLRDLRGALSPAPLLRDERTPREVRSLALATVAGLLLAQLAGSYAAQLSHATGYGAYNARYFLPATLTVAAILVAGPLALRPWARAVSVVGIVLSLWTANVASFVAYATTALGLGTAVTPGGLVSRAVAATEANGVPGAVVPSALVVAALSALLLGVVLARRDGTTPDALRGTSAPAPR